MERSGGARCIARRATTCQSVVEQWSSPAHRDEDSGSPDAGRNYKLIRRHDSNSSVRREENPPVDDAEGHGCRHEPAEPVYQPRCDQFSHHRFSNGAPVEPN